MANYVKTTDFAVKDALPTGNPNKVASGTQVDTELNNIATAIASKEDVGNKAQPNGYASLDSSGDVPSAQISQASVTQHQAALTILESQITDSTVLTRNSGTETISGAWNFTTVPTILGTAVNNASMLTAGTIPDARIAATGVTQHQASLGTDSATASTIARRNSSGYLFAAYFNSTASQESPTLSNLWIESGSDGYLRKSSPTHVKRQLVLTCTIQSDPGGTPSGSPGDVFFYY